jgi:hypothetical protein
MPDGTLPIGGRIKRTDLHREFGGRRQGGISPSAQTPNVFIFSDAASGKQHGYIDSWRNDGCFHYTGEGQRGDQQMISGNRAIRDAGRDGRALRVFEGTGGIVEYRGIFGLDTVQPFYQDDAPETGGGPVRSVIVFRLRPVDGVPKVASRLPAITDKTAVANVPVEENNTERTLVDPAREPYEAERRESALVKRFKEYMQNQQHTVERFRITPAGEAKPIFTDAYVKDLKILMEAKGSIDRNSIRMATGQLLDYRRFIEEATVKCAVLLPEVPRQDLLQLLAYAGILIYFPEKQNFILMDGHGQRVE